MEFNGVFHQAYDNYCYPINEDELIINIKTGYDVKEVNIILGDPFAAGILGGGENWNGDKQPVIFKKKLKNQIWWTTTVKPPYKRLKYYFELITEDERWFYFEDGFVSAEQMALEGRSRQCFVFPWMNPCDIPVTPKWVNDTIWYQIFPDRFCNGDHSIDPEDVVPWRNKGKVKNEECFGGDFAGIINKLDYLKELGISGIYLTPINESPSNHKYDTTDYSKIDPGFGDEETFKTLVKEAHDRGMKIMLDGVFNHCGYYFKPWQDVLEKGQDSQYYEFDAVMNYPLGESIKDFWIDKSLTNRDFEYTINRCYTNYMQQTNDVLFNLLDSHDTKRLRSDVKNLDEYFAQLAVLFAMPGSPCIYYGTEIAMEGSFDPDCRRCMPWDDIESGRYKERINMVSQLIHLRINEPLLKSRNFHFPDDFSDNPRVIQFRKMGWVDTYVEVIINCSEEDIEVPKDGQILFERHCIDTTLLQNGILIRKIEGRS